MSDNDVQKAATPEPSKKESPESQESAFEQLAAKKGFKSPDDLAKSYEALEAKSTKDAQEKADQQKLFFEEKQETPPEGNDSNDQLKELGGFVDERLERQKTELEGKFKQELSKIELQSVIKENPDFGTYAQEVKDIRTKYPGMGFQEALTFAKAQSGAIAQEAKSEALTQASQGAEAQAQAQVAPVKVGTESKPDVADNLKSANWTPDKSGRASDRAVAEIEQIEKELFGEVLQKTPSGL